MVLTGHNSAEAGEMITLATQLGCGGVRFGQLMFNPEVAEESLGLTAEQRRASEIEIRRLRDSASLPVSIAPGYYSESPFFPCGPLELKEFNLDYRGNVTLCCHLSGQFNSNERAHVMGNLHETGLAQLLGALRECVSRYKVDKQERVRHGEFGDLDNFPCWYCVNYLRDKNSPGRGLAPESRPPRFKFQGVSVEIKAQRAAASPGG
jgi:MoaA/NifB/PqqE/SkfB family radical SAM enzyme